MSAPPFIDSLDFAKNRSQLSGELRVADLSRLSDVLESSAGALRYTLRGDVNALDVPYLTLTLAGSCRLQCQRCLSGLDFQVDVENSVLLRTQAELDALEDDDEAFDSILAESNLDIQNLLEEELVLSLPISPRHESCQAVAGQGLQKDVEHPFAALAKLKHP